MGGAQVSFDDLSKQCTTPRNFRRWNEYYYGASHLDALGVSLPPEVRVLELSAMWPKLAVDVLVESLVLEGFTLADQEVPDSLRRSFQANNFDTLWPLIMTEALVQGTAYAVVGPGEDGAPKISGHSAQNFAVRTGMFGDVQEAVQVYQQGTDDFAAHYEPGSITYYGRVHGRWVRQQQVTSGIDTVPVVPVVNRVRLGAGGHSEVADIAKLCDAASRSLTNLQVAQELLSMPIRYLFGDGADEEKVDQFGNAVSQIETYFGRFLTGPAGSTAGQIPGADLNQILGAFKLYAQQVSAMTGIPPFMMGISADSNPTSAEAMQSAKDRLTMRASVKQNLFGDPAEDIARMVLRMNGETVDGLETLESRWRDPAVASVSARNAQMLQAQSQGVISAETTREFMDLSPEQLARESNLDTRSRAVTGA